MPFPPPPIIPPTSGPLDTGQPQPLVPTLPPSPFLTPSCIRDLGRGAWEVERLTEDDLAPASPHPFPQPCHKAAPTRRSVRPAAETQSRVAAGMVMKPPGRITAEGAGWERGGGGGLELVPKLTCSPAGGWRRRGRGESASPGVSGAALASPPAPGPTSPQSCAVGLTVPGAVPVPGLGAGET